MRVLLTDSDLFPFGDRERALLDEDGVVLDEIEGHEAEAIAAFGKSAAAVFAYYARFDRPLIESMSACKVIARCGTGYDRIDVDAARELGMVVTYVPGYGAVDVAEHAIALLFACARHLGRADREVQAGRWPSYRELGVMSRIAGSTLGLLGFGRSAREVAVRATGLRLEVLAHDPFVGATGAPEGVRIVSFDELLWRSDFLSVHVPLTPSTHHLLDATAFARMRPSAFLINTSRGPVVDGEALADALEEGRLSGAGLDVLEQEPPSRRDRLLGRADVLISPHAAAYTEEAIAELTATAVTDVLRVLRGETPRYPVPELDGTGGAR